MSEVCCRCNLPKEPPKHNQESASFRYICRLCLMRAEDTEPIFIHPGDSSLAEKIFACTGVQISENVTVGPTSICMNCKTSVYKSYQFLELCQRNNKIIQNLLASQEKPPAQSSTSTGGQLKIVIRTKSTSQISPVSRKRSNSRRKSTQSRLEESTSASEISWSDSDEEKDDDDEDDEDEVLPIRQLAYETDTPLEESPKRRRMSSPKENRVPSLVIPRARLNGGNTRMSGSTESSISRSSCASILEPLKNDDLFKCEFCNNSFPYQIQIQQHMDLYHSDRKHELSCRFCSKIYLTTAALRKHNEEKHAAKVIECKLCQRFFTSPSGLHQHYRSIVHRAATGEAVYPRRRNSCVSYGYTSPARRNSVNSDYGSEYPSGGNSCRKDSRNASADDYNPYDNSYYDEIARYKCDYCDQSFDDRDTLGQHIAVRPCRVELEPLDLDLLLERMDLDELLMPLNPVPDVTIIEAPIEIVDLT